MPLRLSALAATFLLNAASAHAEQGPSFDCGKAESPVETAICADPKLAALDRQVAGAYAGALDRLDRKGAEALRDDQRSFQAVLRSGMKLDEGVEEAKRIFDLRDELAERAAFLGAVGPAPRGH